VEGSGRKRRREEGGGSRDGVGRGRGVGSRESAGDRGGETGEAEAAE
jgi:hypothetical protein